VSALQKLAAINWRDRILLVEAWLCLSAARACLLMVPFRKIAAHLGRQFPPDHTTGPATPVPPDARRISWAVDVMSRRTPWESACLAQAIAGKFMLRRRRIVSWLFLGTRKDAAGNLAAHAWLQIGPEILLGGAGRESFTALSSFGGPA
jgi:hypothetical protein